MKNSIFKNVILAFILLPSMAFAQQKKDHLHAPLNEVVLEYTLNHFNLKGNVTKIVEGTPEDGLVVTTLFKDGKIIEKSSTSKWSTKETYDYSNSTK